MYFCSFEIPNYTIYNILKYIPLREGTTTVMKRLLLIPLVTMLLLTACSDTETYRLRGILYTDSILTTPIPNATLTFGTGDWYSTTDLPIDSLGHAVTDAQGRWGFAYNVTIDPIARHDTKFKVEYSPLLILYNGDTLYMENYNVIVSDTLKLYPGCWKRERSAK